MSRTVACSYCYRIRFILDSDVHLVERQLTIKLVPFEILLLSLLMKSYCTEIMLVTSKD